MQSEQGLSEQEIEVLRARFPILRDHVYLYNCSQGALSDAVEDGMKEYAESWRNAQAPWDEWIGKYEAVRTAFAEFINAKPEEVAILTSASAGINPIANALQFDGRRKVVMGEFEFPTMGQIWLAQQQRGACVEFLAGVNERIPTEAYARSIDCDTMVVPVSQVSFVNGSRADVLEIARLAHDRGALVFLDGYQDCGTRPVDVKAMDVDFYVTGTLKYLLGPPGLAFLYVRESLIEQLSPSITSWMAQREVFAFNPKRLDPAPSARRFEGGSPPIPNLYMALPALRMLRQIGLDKVAAQIRTLTMAFREGLSELSIDAKTPADSIGPLVVVRCRDADQLVAKLQARNILVSARRDGLRFSFHVYNTLEDVREALKALECNLGLVVRTS